MMDVKRHRLLDRLGAAAMAGVLLIAIGHKSPYVFKVGAAFSTLYALFFAASLAIVVLAWALSLGRVSAGALSPGAHSQILLTALIVSPLLAFLLMLAAGGVGTALSYVLEGDQQSACYRLVETKANYLFRLQGVDEGKQDEVVLRIRSDYFAAWDLQEGGPVRLRWISTPVGDRVLTLQGDPSCGRSK
jgi:hypothetical protein